MDNKYISYLPIDMFRAWNDNDNKNCLEPCSGSFLWPDLFLERNSSAN